MDFLPPNEIGLSRKEWNQALDYYLETKQLDPDIIAQMDDEQRRIINEIKKSNSRRNSKIIKS